MTTIFALVDCNNFYASCERVFDPRLEGKPIVVLSNNDGCIISRSNEAKQLGIPMGAPFHQWKSQLKKNNVFVYSSNYELYGDMSRRVMSILTDFCPDIEYYSIDEAFLSLKGFESRDLSEYALKIRETIKTYTGIPVCIGFSQTKTLAKLANHFAKKAATTGVFDFLDINLQENILRDLPIEDLWGIGLRLAKKLHLFGIHTVKEFRDSNQKIMNEKFSVVVERIIQELNRVSCLPLESIQPRKQIVSSRSFGKLVSDIEELEEAISHYTAKACAKLRNQQHRATGIHVYLQTNEFIQHEKQYSNGISYEFSTPENNTSFIISKAKQCLHKIFRKGYRYQKAGIMLLDLIPEGIQQVDMFSSNKNPKKEKLMSVVDEINLLMGRDTIQFCAEGINKAWKLKCNFRSPRYTTRLDELKQVKCI